MQFDQQVVEVRNTAKDKEGTWMRHNVAFQEVSVPLVACESYQKDRPRERSSFRNK